jgi:hypothetical protein
MRKACAETRPKVFSLYAWLIIWNRSFIDDMRQTHDLPIMRSFYALSQRANIFWLNFPDRISSFKYISFYVFSGVVKWHDISCGSVSSRYATFRRVTEELPFQVTYYSCRDRRLLDAVRRSYSTLRKCKYPNENVLFALIRVIKDCCEYR